MACYLQCRQWVATSPVAGAQIHLPLGSLAGFGRLSRDRGLCAGAVEDAFGMLRCGVVGCVPPTVVASVTTLLSLPMSAVCSIFFSPCLPGGWKHFELCNDQLSPNLHVLEFAGASAALNPSILACFSLARLGLPVGWNMCFFGGCDAPDLCSLLLMFHPSVDPHLFHFSFVQSPDRPSPCPLGCP